MRPRIDASCVIASAAARRARDLEHDVGAGAVRQLATRCDDRRAGIDRLEARAPRANAQPRRVDLADEDARARARARRARRAGRSGRAPITTRGLAGRELGAPHVVAGDGERLDERGQPQVDAVGERGGA